MSKHEKLQKYKRNGWKQKKMVVSSDSIVYCWNKSYKAMNLASKQNSMNSSHTDILLDRHVREKKYI